VRKKYPSVDKALIELGAFSEARLTGTGACVFAQFNSEALAREAYEVLLGNPKWQVYLTKGMNKSLLLDKLAGYRENQ
jgi:4-diphosphocytidyl-2-C-methyl-D-erythritol kinase